MIDRKLVGGMCVNTGCTPTKTLVASTQAAYTARRAADYGVLVEGTIRVDMAWRRAPTPSPGTLAPVSTAGSGT